MRRQRSAGVLWALVTVLVLGACGSKDGVSVRTDGGAGTTAVQADQASAQRALLTPGDLPGYEPVPATASPTQATLNAASTFEECAGAAGSLGADHRTALSPAYFKGTSTAVSSMAIVAPTESQARKAMKDLSRAELAGCLSNLFGSVLGLDAAPGTTTTTEVVPGSVVKDRSVTWRTTIQLAMGTERVWAFSDLTFVRHDRTVATLFDFQLGEPFPADDHARLLEAMAARIG
jgi:hypothetical protein